MKKSIYVVLNVDIAGYTQMCEKMDGEKVFELLSTFFHTGEEIICKQGGIPVRREGDKIIALFGSGNTTLCEPTLAIEAGLQIKDAIRKINPELQLHLSVAENMGVIGDTKKGISFSGEVEKEAERLEDLSIGGEFLVSPHIVGELREKYNFYEKESHNYAVVDRRDWKELKGSIGSFCIRSPRTYIMSPKSSGKSYIMRRYASSLLSQGKNVFFLDLSKVISWDEEEIFMTLDKKDVVFIEHYDLIEDYLTNAVEDKLENLPQVIMEGRGVPSFLPGGTELLNLYGKDYTPGEEIDFLCREFQSRTGFGGTRIGWRLLKKYLEGLSIEERKVLKYLTVYTEGVILSRIRTVGEKFVKDGLIQRTPNHYNFINDDVRNYLLNIMTPDEKERERIRVILDLEEEVGKEEDIISLYIELGNVDKAVATIVRYSKHLIENGDIDGAMKWIEKGLEISKEKKQLLLSLLWTKRECYRKINDVPEEVNILKMLRVLSDGDKGRIMVNIELARVYNNIGDFRKAFSTLSNIKGLQGFKEYELDTKFLLSSIYGNMLKFAKAVNILNELLHLIRKDDFLKRSKIYESFSNIYRIMGKLDLAEDNIKRAILESKKHGEETLTRKLNLSLGSIQFYRSDFKEALNTYLGLLKSPEVEKNLPLKAAVLSNIGGVYQSVDNYPQSLEFFKEALKIDTRIGNEKGRAVRLNNIGTAYAEVGLFRMAKEYFEKAAEMDRDLGNETGELNKLGNLANVLFQIGERKKAKKMLEDVIQKSRKSNLYLNITYYNIELANFYEKEDTKMALDLLIETIKLCKKYNIKGYLVAAYIRLGRIYYTLGELKRARSYAKKAKRLLSKLNGTEWNEIEIFYNIYLILGSKENIAYLKKAYERIREIEASLDDECRKAFLNLNLNREVLTAWERRKGK